MRRALTLQLRAQVRQDFSGDTKSPKGPCREMQGDVGKYYIFGPQGKYMGNSVALNPKVQGLGPKGVPTCLP